MAFKLTWLAAVLRKAGLKVSEVPGWEEAGRGDMGTVKGVILHHTAGAAEGNAPSLKLIMSGRPDLPGPLSHLCLARDGTFHVVAAGRCNHAGAGSWHGVAQGNSEMIGIEAENTGTGRDPWPVEQMIAYERGVAAILWHIGADAVMAAGHKEYALPKGRKIDPAFDMITFRENVRDFMEDRHVVKDVMPAPADPTRSMLRIGDQGASVTMLQQCLGVPVDRGFGPITEAAVKKFQADHKLKADGLVGPATWAALLASK